MKNKLFNFVIIISFVLSLFDCTSPTDKETSTNNSETNQNSDVNTALDGSNTEVSETGFEKDKEYWLISNTNENWNMILIKVDQEIHIFI